MTTSVPHYLLHAEADRAERPGCWRFVLRPSDGSTAVEVSDIEPDSRGERLDLLTVVRALESLDQPSRVTLVGCCHYVEQGIMYGLAEWRDNDWRWEWFGQMVPVRDADLWQRVDRILQFHRVECGQRRFDASHDSVAEPHAQKAASESSGVGVGVETARFSSGDWLPSAAENDANLSISQRFAAFQAAQSIKYAVPALVAWCAVIAEVASRYWQTGVRLAALVCSSLLLHRT